MSDRTPSPHPMKHSFIFPILENSEWSTNKEQINNTGTFYVNASNGYLTKQVEELKMQVRELQKELILIKQQLKINNKQ